jgi:hypothetical protein
MTLDKYIVNLQKLENNLPSIIDKFIESESSHFLGRVKLRFWNQGVDGDGKKIGEYAESTVARKKKKGQRSSHVTLKDSSQWWDNLFITYEKGDLILDNRMRDLTQKLIEGVNRGNPAYGEAIMELTTDEKNDWVQVTLIKLDKYIQNKFNTNVILEI